MTQNASVPDGAIVPWQEAVLKSNTTACWGLFIGASGLLASASDPLVTSYPALFAKDHVSRGYGRYGDAFTPLFSAAWNAMMPAVFVFDHVPDAWNYNVGFPGPYAVYSAATSGSPLFHLTHPSAKLGYNAQSAHLVCWDKAACTLAYNVNGGGTVTDSTSLTGSGKLVRIPVNSMGNAAGNTINVTSVTASNLVLVAVAWYANVTAGAGTGVGWVWAGGTGNLTMNDWWITALSGLPSDRIAPLAGPTSSITAAPPYTTRNGLGFPFGPNLLIVDMFDDPIYITVPPNTQLAGASPHTFVVNALDPIAYRPAMQRVIHAVRAGQGSGGDPNACTIVFHVTSAPDGLNSDVINTGISGIQNYEGYFEALLTLANMYPICLLNTHAEWGEWGSALGFQTVNNLHPSDLGHADIAHRLKARIGL